ncbi:MAG: MarR family transcriptional regulator [Candidatus Sericytochromatia bacterium]|jgi:DNA-binding MarR family transcriptional regulator|nr:MarR family transcriptional regulator [Candidatus Sericytochromatia bacterium]
MKNNQHLSHQLLDLTKVVTRLVKEEFRGDGSLTLTQFNILKTVNHGICQVGKIAKSFGISQPATSIIVNSMVEQDLLQRVPHPNDRRKIELQLTARAKKHLEKGYQNVFAKMDARLSSLTDSEKITLTQQIQQITLLLSKEEF